MKHSYLCEMADGPVWSLKILRQSLCVNVLDSNSASQWSSSLFQHECVMFLSPQGCRLKRKWMRSHSALVMFSCELGVLRLCNAIILGSGPRTLYPYQPVTSTPLTTAHWSSTTQTRWTPACMSVTYVTVTRILWWVSRNTMSPVSTKYV